MEINIHVIRLYVIGAGLGFKQFVFVTALGNGKAVSKMGTKVLTGALLVYGERGGSEPVLSSRTKVFDGLATGLFNTSMRQRIGYGVKGF